MKAPKPSKLPYETSVPKIHHTKASTTVSNPTTASTMTPDNSVFLKQFIDKNEKLKQMGSSCNVIKTCCPQFPSNLKSIFASDKRRAEAVNYVKKLRCNKSQLMDVDETQNNNKKTSMSKIFNESPIRAVPISSQKNMLTMHNQPVSSRYNYSNMCQYSTPNMFANYTSRAPQNHQTTIALNKKRINQIEMDNLLDDDIYDNNNNNNNINNYNEFEKEEVFFYDDKDYDYDDDEIQILYSRNETDVNNNNNNKQNSIYKPLDINIPEIPQTLRKNNNNNMFKDSSVKEKFNGYVITEYENGNKVNEYECMKYGNWKKINESLLNDEVSLGGKILQFVDLNDYEKAKDIIKEYENNKKHKTRHIGTNTINKEHKKPKLIKQQTEEFTHIAKQDPKPIRLRRQKIERFSYIAEEKEKENIQYEYIDNFISVNEVNVKYISKIKKRKVMKKQTTIQYEYIKPKDKKKYNIGINTIMFPFTLCKCVQLTQICSSIKDKVFSLEKVERFSQLAKDKRKMCCEEGMNTDKEELCVDNMNNNNNVEYVIQRKEYVDESVGIDVNVIDEKEVQTDIEENCIKEDKEMNTERVDYIKQCSCEYFDIICKQNSLCACTEDIHIQTDTYAIETKDEEITTDDNNHNVMNTIMHINEIEYTCYKVNDIIKEDIECQTERCVNINTSSITNEQVVEFIHNDGVIKKEFIENGNQTEIEEVKVNNELCVMKHNIEFVCERNEVNTCDSEIQTENDFKETETNTEDNSLNNEIAFNDKIEFIYNKQNPITSTIEIQTDNISLHNEETNTELISNANEIVVNDNIEYIHMKPKMLVINTEMQTEDNIMKIELENKAVNTDAVISKSELLNLNCIEHNELILLHTKSKMNMLHDMEIQRVGYDEYIKPYKELCDMEMNTEIINEIVTNDRIEYISNNKTLSLNFKVHNNIQLQYESSLSLVSQSKPNINEISFNNNTFEYIVNQSLIKQKHIIDMQDTETNTSVISTPTQTLTYEIILNENIEYPYTKSYPQTSHIETQTEESFLLYNSNQHLPSTNNSFLSKTPKQEFSLSTSEQLTDEDHILTTQHKSELQSETQTQDYHSNSYQYSSLEQTPISIETPQEQEQTMLKSKLNRRSIRIIPKEEADSLNITQTDSFNQTHFAFNDSSDEVIIASASVKEKIRRIQSAYGIHSYNNSSNSNNEDVMSINTPMIMTVLSHKPVAMKKKKKFTYNDFDESYSKEDLIHKEEQNNIITARSKALLFRQKLKKNAEHKAQ